MKQPRPHHRSTRPQEDLVELDLSREEREFHQVQQGLVLLFHSGQNGEGGSPYGSKKSGMKRFGTNKSS